MLAVSACAPQAAHDALDAILDACTDGGRYRGECGVKYFAHRDGRSGQPVSFRTPHDGAQARGPSLSDSPANAEARRQAHAELDRAAARAAVVPSRRALVRVEVLVADDTAQSVKAYLVPSDD